MKNSLATIQKELKKLEFSENIQKDLISILKKGTKNDFFILVNKIIQNLLEEYGFTSSNELTEYYKALLDDIENTKKEMQEIVQKRNLYKEQTEKRNQLEKERKEKMSYLAKVIREKNRYHKLGKKILYLEELKDKIDNIKKQLIKNLNTKKGNSKVPVKSYKTSSYKEKPNKSGKIENTEKDKFPEFSKLPNSKEKIIWIEENKENLSPEDGLFLLKKINFFNLTSSYQNKYEELELYFETKNLSTEEKEFKKLLNILINLIPSKYFEFLSPIFQEEKGIKFYEFLLKNNLKNKLITEIFIQTTPNIDYAVEKKLYKYSFSFGIILFKRIVNINTGNKQEKLDIVFNYLLNNIEKWSEILEDFYNFLKENQLNEYLDKLEQKKKELENNKLKASKNIQPDNKNLKKDSPKNPSNTIQEKEKEKEKEEEEEEEKNKISTDTKDKETNNENSSLELNELLNIIEHLKLEISFLKQKVNNLEEELKSLKEKNKKNKKNKKNISLENLILEIEKISSWEEFLEVYRKNYFKIHQKITDKNKEYLKKIYILLIKKFEETFPYDKKDEINIHTRRIITTIIKKLNTLGKNIELTQKLKHILSNEKKSEKKSSINKKEQLKSVENKKQLLDNIKSFEEALLFYKKNKKLSAKELKQLIDILDKYAGEYNPQIHNKKGAFIRKLNTIRKKIKEEEKDFEFDTSFLSKFGLVIIDNSLQSKGDYNSKKPKNQKTNPIKKILDTNENFQEKEPKPDREKFFKIIFSNISLKNNLSPTGKTWYSIGIKKLYEFYGLYGKLTEEESKKIISKLKFNDMLELYENGILILSITDLLSIVIQLLLNQNRLERSLYKVNETNIKTILNIIEEVKKLDFRYLYTLNNGDYVNSFRNLGIKKDNFTEKLNKLAEEIKSFV